jgi:hypothetical protein
VSPEDTCNKCQKAGKECGLKTLVQKDDPFLQPKAQPDEDSSKPSFSLGSYQEWSLNEPLLPQIFKHFDTQLSTKAQVLDKLDEELFKLESLGIWSSSLRSPLSPERRVSNEPRQIFHDTPPREERAGGMTSEKYPRLSTHTSSHFTYPAQRLPADFVSQSETLPTSSISTALPNNSLVPLLKAVDLLGEVSDPAPPYISDNPSKPRRFRMENTVFNSMDRKA